MFEINLKITLSVITYLLRNSFILNLRFTFYIFNSINKFINLRVFILGNYVYVGNNSYRLKNTVT